jgi:hypothetical protein
MPANRHEFSRLVHQFRHLVDRRSAQILAEKTNTPGPSSFARGPDLADLEEPSTLN